MQVSVGAGPVRVYGPAALAWWLAGRALIGVVRLLYVAASHPRTACALLAGLVLVWAVLTHPVGTLGVAVGVLEVGHGWRLLGPGSWRQWGRPRLLGWWRSVWVYRRRWAVAMRVAELERVGPDGSRDLPRLSRVRCTPTTDVVRVRALLGQRFTDWEAAGPMLGHVFGASAFVVHRGDNRRLTLELVRGARGRAWRRGSLHY